MTIELSTQIRNAVRGLTKRWGPSSLKRELWDKEYAAGKWTHCENTEADPIYSYIEKYCKGGTVLDLGCGSGNTSNELSFDRYQEYTGIDISKVALDKAAARSEKNGRGAKNRYVQSDVLFYMPAQKHDVIVFRDSVHNIPRPKIKGALNRYLQWLKQDGVLIVRISGHDCTDFEQIAALIEAEYRVVDRYTGPESGRVITLVFR